MPCLTFEVKRNMTRNKLIYSFLSQDIPEIYHQVIKLGVTAIGKPGKSNKSVECKLENMNKQIEPNFFLELSNIRDFFFTYH